MIPSPQIHNLMVLFFVFVCLLVLICVEFSFALKDSIHSYLCLCVCISVVYTHIYAGALHRPEAGVTGSCGSPEMDAGLEFP